MKCGPALILVAAFFLPGAAPANPPGDTIRKPAVFRVTTDIVHRNVQPFAANIDSFGNSLTGNGAGFEPVVFRNKFIASVDSPDRVIAPPEALSQWDTLREGFLDDATVHVYRIENGRFRMVREDRVTAGGAHASGWIRALPGNQVIAPDTTRYSFRWDSWNRPGARYYFVVRAIDKFGNLSPESPTFEISSPEKTGEPVTPRNTLVPFEPARKPAFGAKPINPPDSLRGKLGGDGRLMLEWEPVGSTDLAGYIVYRSDYPPHRHSGYYLQLSGKPASPAQHVKTGDMVVISKKIYSLSRNRDLAYRVWGAGNEYNKLMPGLIQSFPDETPGKTWSLVRHPADTPVEEPGETFLELRLAAGARESLTIYNHSGTDQFWYDVLEKRAYKAEVWLRQEGNGSVRFRLTGFHGNGPHIIKPVVFDVGRGWKKYVTLFTPRAVQSGSSPGAMVLEFTGPATFHVDNFRVYRADTPYLDLLPHEYESIRSSGIPSLRTPGLIMTGVRTYDMDQFTNSGGANSGTRKSNTLPQTLAMMRAAGVRPWLQIEFHMNPREWLGFVEYMAAPYDPKVDSPASKPWAHKRHRQGQTRPWVQEFDRIHLELSNETWNSLFAPWTFSPMTDAVSKKRYSPGEVYGLFQEYVRSVMRSSPYWQSAHLGEKFIFMLGGWAGVVEYGHDAASTSPSSNFLTIAAYNGGWDQAEDPLKPDPAGLFRILSDVNQSAVPVADLFVKKLRELKTRGLRHLQLGAYEAGPGYVMNGLNNARVTAEQARAQEQAMKSLAAGTATLDSFLARAYRGFVIQNFYAFGTGDRWKSHAEWYHGGQAYPSWKLLALFNNEATGDMLRTETLGVPTTNLEAFGRRHATKNAPLAAIYATRRENRYSVFILSRKIPNHPAKGDDGYTPVSIELPFARAKSITLYRMTGAPDANNMFRDDVRIEKLEIPASELGSRFNLNARTGADERGLPPVSSFLYVFEEVDDDGPAPPSRNGRSTTPANPLARRD